MTGRQDGSNELVSWAAFAAFWILAVFAALHAVGGFPSEPAAAVGFVLTLAGGGWLLALSLAALGQVVARRPQ